MDLQSFMRPWRDPLGIRQCRTGSPDLSLGLLESKRYEPSIIHSCATFTPGYFKSSEGQGALKQPRCSPAPGLTSSYSNPGEPWFSIICSDGRLGSDAPFHLWHSHLLPYSLPTNYIYSGSTISFFPCVLEQFSGLLRHCESDVSEVRYSALYFKCFFHRHSFKI